MTDPQTTSAHTNRLAAEKSPYLLQHAHNPVDWFPWGDEAWEKSRAENKPVFLSIGYSACHWCHVMERESFENEAIAALMNRYFICVKVDREERPDVDEIYMTAVQRMTGSGGWPLSVFLLPDGRPFYGGTYFPPTPGRGRIAFPSLVEQLGEAFTSRHDELLDVADRLMTDLSAASRQSPVPHPGTVQPAELLAGAVSDLYERFDDQNGGFGDAPKFPPHHALRLLIAAFDDGNDDALPLLAGTLDKMALGGIYDHVGGGFHRYATDAKWLLPHFEKMLYDNALLLRVYAEAGELLDNESYRRVARETADWCLRDLLDSDTGGFTAALDADSEGVEGKYYVWTTDEVQTVLGDAAGEAFARTYRFTGAGNFVDEATHQRSGANIPHLSLGADAVPLPTALTPELLAARQRLLDARYERVPPGKDDKIITAWNGLTIGALAFAGKSLDEPEYIAAAKRAANFCLTTLKPNGELLRRYAKGEAAIPAFLDDYAFLADGLLDLYEATGETQWVNEARDLTDTLLERFWDADETGFFYTGTAHETLIERTKEFFDGALPAANGVAARVLARLGNLPNGERYTETVRELLTAYHGLLARAPQGTPTLILAARETYQSDAPTVPVREAVAVRADADTLTLAPGESGAATFTLTVADGYHINARFASRADLVATVALIGTSAPAAIGAVAFPAPTDYDDGAGETLPVYVGTVPVTIPVTVAHDAAPGTYSVTLTVRAQPCTNFECLTPVERTASVKLVVPTEPEPPEKTWGTLIPYLQERIESTNSFLNVDIPVMAAAGIDDDTLSELRELYEKPRMRLNAFVPLVARMNQEPQLQSIKPHLSMQTIRLIDTEDFALLDVEADGTYRLSQPTQISGRTWEHSILYTGTLDEIVAVTIALVESRRTVAG